MHIAFTIMDKFIREILDTDDLATAGPYIKDGNLQYDLIFESPIVIHCLCCCWAWKELLGVYPPRSLVQPTATVEDAMAVVKVNSFYRLFPGEVDKVGTELTVKFHAYAKTLATNKGFVKSELFEKIKDRVNPFWTEQYQADKTLYSQFHDMRKMADPYVAVGAFNPITKFVIPIIFTNAISKYDALKTIYNTDYYFSRLLMQGPIALIYEPMLSYKGLGNPSIIIGVDEGIRKVCANAFVCNVDDIKDMCVCAPKWGKMCIVMAGTTTLSKNPANTIYLKALTDLFEYREIYDLVISTQVEGNAIPAPIQNCIIQEFIKHIKHIKHIKNPTNVLSHHPNCILLIDNRINILSVMSAVITMGNLKPELWDLVILTSYENEHYYRGWFPGAKIIHHPLMDGKFNIETYNKLLKDELVWANMLEYEKCLTVQDDGTLFRPGVEDVFLGYDWVGAPWPRGQHLVDAKVGSNFVGNGGLSLRNVKMMHDICKTCDPVEKLQLFNTNIQPEPEDVFFSREVTKRGGLVPSHELARRFAMEQLPMTDPLVPFGIHKPWAYQGVPAVIEYFAKI